MCSQVIWERSHALVVAELVSVELALLQVALAVELEVVVGDLVGELADGWHFDRSGPVGVHERLAEGQVLNVKLAYLIVRLVQGNVEVCWLDASNGGLLRDQEEVKALVIGVFD